MTWIVTRSGVDLDFAAPDPAAINLADLAVVLSRVARYAGHTRGSLPFSVAQHSVLVLTLAERTMRLSGIPVGSNLWRRARAYAVFQDASEAYSGDTTQPLKVMLGTAFSEIEDRVQSAVHAKLGLEWPVAPEVKRIVKHADLQALATERRDLLAPTARMWTQGLPEPAPEPVVPQAPEDAAALFLAATRMVLGLSSEDICAGYSVPAGPTALEPTGE